MFKFKIQNMYKSSPIIISNADSYTYLPMYLTDIGYSIKIRNFKSIKMPKTIKSLFSKILIKTAF